MSECFPRSKPALADLTKSANLSALAIEFLRKISYALSVNFLTLLNMPNGIEQRIFNHNKRT